MLKLKLQYFGHLMGRTDSFEKTLMLERLSGGEGGDRGWDGWMASLSQCTWVWEDSGSWWWTGRPGVLQSMRSQRVGHGRVTELNQINRSFFLFSLVALGSCCLPTPQRNNILKSMLWAEGPGPLLCLLKHSCNLTCNLHVSPSESPLKTLTGFLSYTCPVADLCKEKGFIYHLACPHRPSTGPGWRCRSHSPSSGWPVSGQAPCCV